MGDRERKKIIMVSIFPYLMKSVQKKRYASWRKYHVVQRWEEPTILEHYHQFFNSVEQAREYVRKERLIADREFDYIVREIISFQPYKSKLIFQLNN